MTIAYRLNGALLPFSSVRFNPEAGASFPASAWYCEPMVAGVIIEDQSGTLDLTGWSTFTVEETACSKPRIFTGWIAGKEISRGRDSNRVGTARVWNCDIVDQNALFSFEVFRSTAASVRPAETDVERIQAMIASHAMAGTPIYDNGRLSTDDPVDIGAANFVTQFPAEMAVSTAGQSGKNVYAYWDESADQISIHYDAIGVGPAATISFSNVASDVNSTTVFAPFRDAVLRQDPYSLYTGFLMGWVGGYTYQRNQTLIDALSPTEFSPINFLRDQFYSTSRIGRSATAATYTARYLEDNGVEKETLTFSALLPASVVNLAHAGDVISVRFSHLPGFSSATDVVIIRRSVTPVDGHDSLYEVGFECATFAEHGPGGGGSFPGGQACSPGNIVLVNEYVDTEATTLTVNITTPPTPGNLLIFTTTYRASSTAGAIAGWTLSPLGTTGGRIATYYRVADGSETSVTTNWSPFANETRGYVAEYTGVSDDLIGSDDNSGVDTGDCFAGTVTPSSGQVVLIFSAIAYDEGGDAWSQDEPVWGAGAETLVFNIAEGANRPAQAVGAQATTGTGAAITHTLTVDISLNGDESYEAQTLMFLCSGSSDIPNIPGTQIPPRTPTGDVDGSNTDFATDEPFADGSLYVLHDGIDQTDHVTTSDPEAGTYSLDYAPSAGSTLRHGYQVHP